MESGVFSTSTVSYGSPYTAHSSCNKYGVDPPVIVDSSGKYYGHLMLNVRYPEIGLGRQLLDWLMTACRG